MELMMARNSLFFF